ncbi:MAG: hypothetical protein A2953_00025 [Candidatus Levybacteria bacterium RIFCSPLOWO2_01_FULL_36_54]|nr:MAG: hypothetical protein A2953_00025 [Candidatus Levybacteria bacterium RIFCSPLOWO2_01_FULL_36_54]
MKIGIFDPYLDDLGGGEKYMMKIAQCLAKNHNISIFWDRKKDLEELKERFQLNLSNIALTPNIFTKSTGLLKRLWESKKFDAIILLSDGSIPFLLSKKTFIHIQQPLPNKNINIKTKIKIFRINRFFCNSYYTKSYVDKSLGVNSVVLYPPVELKPKKVKKENIILHVGRLRVRDVATRENGDIEGIGDYKKQDFMVDAFIKMIKEGLKGWKFVLAVSVKKEDQKIFETFKKRTKGYPIEFIINKNNNDLWDIYSKSKIYWHASGFGENLKEHPEFAEHFGISTVEAMGAGAVPVVINAGGQKEIVTDDENGFLWNSLDDLIEKTQLLINDEKLWLQMSQQAVKRARDFTGDRFCEELYKILDL